MPSYNLKEFEIKNKHIFINTFCTGLFIIIAFIIYKNM
jgi:hypothetical protein